MHIGKKKGKIQLFCVEGIRIDYHCIEVTFNSCRKRDSEENCLTLPGTNGTFRPLPDSYRKLASLLGAATAVMGLLGLLGWILGMPLLSSIRSSYIPMAPLTSIVFLCLGGCSLFT